MREDRPSSRRVRLYDEELPAPGIRAADRPDVHKDPNNGLRQIEIRFCHHFNAYSEPAKAAIWAGYRPQSAAKTAHKLLNDPRIKRYIAALEADQLRRLRFDADKFMAREIMRAEGDPSEVVEVWVPPCRYCWGINHEYQRTYAEFLEDWEAWVRLPDEVRRVRHSQLSMSYGQVLVYDSENKKVPFDQKGGDGYDSAQPPNPSCPNCHGRGLEDPERGTVPYVRIKPTAYMSETGRALYAGAKHGPRGVEIAIQNQDAARGRLMGMFAKFLDLKASGGLQQEGGGPTSFQMGLIAPVANLLTDDPASMSNAQLDALLAQHGVVITDDGDGQGGEGEAGGGNSGEAPPPDRVA